MKSPSLLRHCNVFWIALSAIACTTFVSAASDSENKANVLIITGDEIGLHDWLACSSKAREVLNESGKCNVSVVGNPQILDDAKRLEGIDAIYMAMCNIRTPSLSEKSRKNLTDYVRNGGGLVVVHFASNAFRDWEEYQNLVGRRWIGKVSGHGPRGPFKVEIADRDHYITEGINDFTTDDELYARLQGDAPIHVLAQAYSDWSGENEPLAFTLSYGEGRVFHCPLGHDVRALNTPEVEKLLTRGTLWAAREELE